MSISFDSSDIPQRIRARDPEVLESAVREFLPQVVRAARGAGFSEAEAEDVAQATFLTFFEKAESFEGRSHVRTWLFGILYRKLLERRRAMKRDQQIDDIDDFMDRRFDQSGAWSTPPRPADVQLYNREVIVHMTDCLDGSPEKQRLAFTLREVEEMPTEEICKILDVTATNLGVILFRVRNRLRECLESKGVWSSR